MKLHGGCTLHTGIGPCLIAWCWTSNISVEGKTGLSHPIPAMNQKPHRIAVKSPECWWDWYLVDWRSKGRVTFQFDRRCRITALSAIKRFAMEILLDDVIDTHIHLSEHYKGGLQNTWHPNEAEGFHRDTCWQLNFYFEDYTWLLYIM